MQITKQKNKKVILRIPNDKSFISLARLILAAQLNKNSIDEESIDDLKLVLSEFLTRAIEANLVYDHILVETFFKDNILKMKLSKFFKFDPEKLFYSPYLNFKLIKILVDDFSLSCSQGSCDVVISKGFMIKG